MALENCKECGHQVSKSASQCPKCGYKFKRTSAFTKFVTGLILAVVVFGFAESMLLGSTASSTSSGTSSVPQAAPVNLTPEQQAEAEAKRRADEAKELGLTWQYRESKEEMSQRIVKTAEVRSLNQFNFEFPYNGTQRASLMLRSHPRYGNDVILSVAMGQFLCRFDGCEVSIKFDDGKVMSFQAAEPADHSTTFLFITENDRFVSNAKRAKKVFIEAAFYQEGARVFEFDVSGLTW